MLIVDRGQSHCSESRFTRLPELLGNLDVLVFNRSQVIPARLFGSLEGGAPLELLLLDEQSPARWRCLAKPLKKLKPGIEITFSQDLRARVIGRESEGQVDVEFSSLSANEPIREILFRHGVMPIPPYIRQGRADREDCIDYQSPFAAVEGSIAAPTASLHFTPQLLSHLRAREVGMEFLTLHIGLASVQPLSRPGEETHQPGYERYLFDMALLERLRDLKRRGRRIVAVGTTVVRALESMARGVGLQTGVIERAAEVQQEKLCCTDLFISPGFQFELVDAMITNFHQPGSSHLLLVEAFMGRALLEESYRLALAQQLRFLSYGDGMVIL